MNIIRVRNVHRALPIAVEMLHLTGAKRDSRSGSVFVVDGPVTTMYERPEERVLFWAERDANPFFHFYESLWMLGGRNDVKSLTRFTKNMAQFSDDGETFYGAYGFRWRVAMPADTHPSCRDQLTVITEMLQKDHKERRCVLQMWDSLSDLNHVGKDVPCNVMVTFQISADGYLNMVVFNRSNDIIWGCYGANAVHFSMLLEYMARRIGVKIGTYHQVSVNWHGYDKTFLPVYEKFSRVKITDCIADLSMDEFCPYACEVVKPYPLMESWSPEWDKALDRLLKSNGYAPASEVWPDPFFMDVAIPILRAHDAYQDTHNENRFERALKMLNGCMATDWRLACEEWISRRWNNFKERGHEA